MMLDLMYDVIWIVISRIAILTFFCFLIGKASRMFLEMTSACNTKDRICAFYHPYCDGGGGGERVLWMAVDAILQDPTISNDLHIVIYSGSEKSKKEILKHVKDRFSIDLRNPYLSNKITFIPLWLHVLTDAKWYPVATMFFQCLASIVVGLECVFKSSPCFYVDTTGAAFTYPIFRVISWPCKVIAYVHYPIISSDMLDKVRDQRPDYNNSEQITKSATISTAKLAYYSAIARAYGYVGKYANRILVNSSWTKGHIGGLWRQECKLLYPPCNTSLMECIPLGSSAPTDKRDVTKYFLVSVGQFRPEKDHMLQLRSMKLWVDQYGNRYPGAELVIIGSTRNEEDMRLQRSLEERARELGLSKRVRFVVNAPFNTLTEWMTRGHVGLHTMWNEHFGISVVEMMAAGLVMIAHDSGGPRMDIVRPALRAGDVSSTETGTDASDIVAKGSTDYVGYVANTPEEYATCIQDALDVVCGKSDCKGGNCLELQKRARKHVSGHFSDAAFTYYIQNLFRSLIRDKVAEDKQFIYSTLKAWLLSPVTSILERSRKKHD